MSFTIKKSDFDGWCGQYKIIISNKVSCEKSYKYFIGCRDDEKVIPLCIMFP